MLIDSFYNYINSVDKLKTPAGFLTSDSRNVLIGDINNYKESKPSDVIYKRAGYTAFGQLDSGVSSVGNAIKSKWVFKPNLPGVERLLRSYDGATTGTGRLEVEYNGVFYGLLTGLTNTKFRWVNWWDNSKIIPLALGVNGTDNVYSWNGAIADIASVTSNTITKQGTESWAELNFYTTGTREVIIKGHKYSYTGGHGTTTLTGVSPVGAAPALDTIGVVAGDPCIQNIVTNANVPIAGFKPDAIGIFNNYVYYGSAKNRVVYHSKSTDFTDIAYTSPLRKPAEGGELLLDEAVVGFKTSDNSLIIFCKTDYIYEAYYQLSSDNSSEVSSVKLVNSGGGQSAISQEAICNIKNSKIVYITAEKTLDDFGRIPFVESRNSQPISNDVEKDFLTFDLTDAETVYFQQNIYISLPNEGLTLIFDVKNGRWQPPQTLPLTYCVYKNKLIGHSLSENKSYEMFTSMSDDGIEVEAIIALNYDSNNRLDLSKHFSRFMTGFRASAGAKVAVTYNPNLLEEIKILEATGADQKGLYQPNISISLGANSLGQRPLGYLLQDVELAYYVRGSKIKPKNYFFQQIKYKITGDSAQFELLWYFMDTVNSDDTLGFIY